MSFGPPRRPKSGVPSSPHRRVSSPRVSAATNDAVLSPPPRRDEQSRLRRYVHSIHRREPPRHGISVHSPTQTEPTRRRPARAEEAEEEFVSNPYIRSVLRGAEQRWMPPSLAQSPFDYQSRSQSLIQYSKERVPYLSRHDLVREWKKKMRHGAESDAPHTHTPTPARSNGTQTATGGSPSERRQESLQRLQHWGRQQGMREGGERMRTRGEHPTPHAPPPADDESHKSHESVYQADTAAMAPSRSSLHNPSEHTLSQRSTSQDAWNRTLHAACGSPPKATEAALWCGNGEEENPRAYLYSPSRHHRLSCRAGAPIPASFREQFGVPLKTSCVGARSTVTAAPPVVYVTPSASRSMPSVTPRIHHQRGEGGNGRPLRDVVHAAPGVAVPGDSRLVWTGEVNFLVGPSTQVVELRQDGGCRVAEADPPRNGGGEEMHAYTQKGTRYETHGASDAEELVFHTLMERFNEQARQQM